MSTAPLPLSTVGTVTLDITNHWTGEDELPFEQVAERVLQIEAHNEAGDAAHGTLTFSLRRQRSLGFLPTDAQPARNDIAGCPLMNGALSL